MYNLNRKKHNHNLLSFLFASENVIHNDDFVLTLPLRAVTQHEIEIMTILMYVSSYLFNVVIFLTFS